MPEKIMTLFLAVFHLHVLYPSSNSEYIEMMFSQLLLNAQNSRSVFRYFFFYINTDFLQKHELSREFVFLILKKSTIKRFEVKLQHWRCMKMKILLLYLKAIIHV